MSNNLNQNESFPFRFEHVASHVFEAVKLKKNI